MGCMKSTGHMFIIPVLDNFIVLHEFTLHRLQETYLEGGANK